MDPRGRELTELARRRGEYGAVMSGFGGWWSLLAALYMFRSC
jgi:hypothetical protein